MKQSSSLQTAVLWFVGLGTVANSIWMLAAPEHWYHNLPALVPEFGPYNVHFVRDIGCAFLTIGAALVWGARRLSARFVAAGVGAIFFGLHALVHVFDTARGHVGHHHWWVDFPLVYLPAILLIWITLSNRPSS